MIVTLSRCRTGLNTSITPPLTLTHSHPATTRQQGGCKLWLKHGKLSPAHKQEVMSACSVVNCHRQFSVPVDLCDLMFSPAPSALRLPPLPSCLLDSAALCLGPTAWAAQLQKSAIQNSHFFCHFAYIFYSCCLTIFLFSWHFLFLVWLPDQTGIAAPASGSSQFKSVHSIVCSWVSCMVTQ